MSTSHYRDDGTVWRKNISKNIWAVNPQSWRKLAVPSLSTLLCSQVWNPILTNVIHCCCTLTLSMIEARSLWPQVPTYLLCNCPLTSRRRHSLPQSFISKQGDDANPKAARHRDHLKRATWRPCTCLALEKSYSFSTIPEACKYTKTLVCLQILPNINFFIVYKLCLYLSLSNDTSINTFLVTIGFYFIFLYVSIWYLFFCKISGIQL